MRKEIKFLRNTKQLPNSSLQDYCQVEYYKPRNGVDMLRQLFSCLYIVTYFRTFLL